MRSMKNTVPQTFARASATKIPLALILFTVLAFEGIKAIRAG
jgi:hypothetical protein